MAGRRKALGPARIEPPDLRWRLLSSLVLLALAVGAMLLTQEAAAENRSLQVVGVQPLDASASKAGGPRQAAVNKALYEGVSRVALDLVAEYGPPLQADGRRADGSGRSGGAPEPSAVASALGKDMTPYARSFRIVEDQGSRPVLFPGESEATREYVVVVDVTVDVDRVRLRLSDRGLIVIEVEAAAGGGLEIDARGLRHWSGFEAFVALLQSPRVGATEVRPLEFEDGRALLYAAVDGEPEDVLARIMAAAPADLKISARPDQGRGLTIVKDEAPASAHLGSEDVPRIELFVLWTPPVGNGR